MKIIYILLLITMLVFTGLQYNDSDGLYWAIIYLVPAIALAFAAFAPHRLQSLLGRFLLVIAVLILAFGVYVYWPQKAFFWQTEVWWDDEPVKEGMGVGIAYLCTCLTLPLAFRKSTAKQKKS